MPACHPWQAKLAAAGQLLLAVLVLQGAQPVQSQTSPPPPPPSPPPPPPPATPLRPIVAAQTSVSVTAYGSVQVLLNYTDYLGTWTNTYTLSAGAHALLTGSFFHSLLSQVL